MSPALWTMVILGDGAIALVSIISIQKISKYFSTVPVRPVLHECSTCGATVTLDVRQKHVDFHARLDAASQAIRVIAERTGGPFETHTHVEVDFREV